MLSLSVFNSIPLLTQPPQPNQVNQYNDTDHWKCFKESVEITDEEPTVHSIQKILAAPYDTDTSKIAKKTCVRGAGPWGFFAEFLWVLNHLEYCLANNLKPVIHWDKGFAYYSPQGYNDSTNCWEYYFHPVSDGKYRRGDYEHLDSYYPRDNDFTTIWWYVQYIDNHLMLPRAEQDAFKGVENHAQRYASKNFSDQRRLAYPVGKHHLYDKEFRHWIKDNLLNPFVKIKANIQAKIDNFYTAYMQGKKTIGLHLRGKHIGNEVIHVDHKYLFEEANKYMDQGYQCFVATDLEPLLALAKQELHGPVIFWESQRFATTTSPYTGSKKLHPILGENIIIETMLLSRCDHLIHTLSNVSTTALYFNPTLEHTLIF